MNKYISIYTEYNDLCKEKLEKSEKELQEKINEEYWRFTRSSGTKSPKNPPMIENGKRLSEVQKLLGKKKDFFQMTQNQAFLLYRMPKIKHIEYVKKAIKDGQYIPEIVLEDYPELKNNFE